MSNDRTPTVQVGVFTHKIRQKHIECSGFEPQKMQECVFMARFTNYATLSYTGGTTESNTVVGELVETLSVSKTAVTDLYEQDGKITYAIALTNSGTVAATGITVTDDLGGYSYGTSTVYPLAYRAGTVRQFINGTLSAAPTVNAGPPLTFSGITVPAGGNVVIVYEADVTAYAPLGQTATITNTATVTGGGLTAAMTAQATVNASTGTDLSITKALSPTTVQENGQLTYTFVISNDGAVDAVATDQLVLTDTFEPRLRNVSVTFNGTAWTQGVNYTYNETTGVFTTVTGQITVPAATYTQNGSGQYVTTPGTSTLVITGTV